MFNFPNVMVCHAILLVFRKTGAHVVEQVTDLPDNDGAKTRIILIQWHNFLVRVPGARDFCKILYLAKGILPIIRQNVC